MNGLVHTPRLRALALGIAGVLWCVTAFAAEPRLTNGRLAQGIHRMTLSEVGRMYASNPTRQRLFRSLVLALPAFQKAGITRMYLGGSFVTNKSAPGDLDIAVDGDGPVDWQGVVDAARRAAGYGLSVYRARAKAADALDLELEPVQRRRWMIHKPTMLELFQQNKEGPVGVVELSLARKESAHE